MKAWIAERWTKWWPRLCDGAVAVAREWWESIGDDPRAHFVSMVFGIAVLYAVKLVAWLVL